MSAFKASLTLTSIQELKLNWINSGWGRPWTDLQSHTPFTPVGTLYFPAGKCLEINLKHSSFFSAHLNERLMLKHLLFLIKTHFIVSCYFLS